jgi:hypothetical protein
MLIPFGLVYIHRPANDRTAARYLATIGPGLDELSFEGPAMFHGQVENQLLMKPAHWCIVHQTYWLDEDYRACPRCHANEVGNIKILLLAETSATPESPA